MRHVITSQCRSLESDEACVVVVSDTHGRPHPALLELVWSRRPGLILHAGDVGEGTGEAAGVEAAVVPGARGVGPAPLTGGARATGGGVTEGQGTCLGELGAIAPVVAVRGNMDSRDMGLPDSVDLCVERPTGPRLRLLLTHVGLARLHLVRATRLRAQAADAQLVVFGHSHMPFVGRDGRFALFNPGSAGPRRFGLPITFGVLGFTPRGLDLAHVDLESGRPWRPA